MEHVSFQDSVAQEPPGYWKEEALACSVALTLARWLAG